MQGIYVASDLTGLVLAYLDKNGVAAPDIRRRIAAWPQHTQLPMEDWWELLETLQAQLHEPGLGLKIGACVQPEHTGVMAYLIMHCSSLGEALLRFQRYQKLLHNMSEVLLDSDGQVLKMSWDADLGISTHLSNEVFMGGLTTFVRQIVSDDATNPFGPKAIHFPHAAPFPEAMYQSVLGCPVYFSQPRVAIEMDVALLALPINTRNPFLLELLEKQAEALLDRSERPDAFLDSVQSVCVEMLNNGIPTLEAVARRLNLSTRTLHRRLEERGLNFNGMLRETRFRLAKHYLEDPRLDLNQIAFLLGYSEQSAFTRAFRGWAGVSPMRYRRLLGSG